MDIRFLLQTAGRRARPITALLCGSLVSAAAGQSPATASIPPVAITHVSVIDLTGGPTQPEMTVVIENGRITRIEKTLRGAALKGATVIDGRGKYLIPGLWDMHVHLSWLHANALPLLIANGVTTVRDLAGKLTEIDDWRTRISAGLIVGPRIYRAGPILNGKSFNQYQMVPGNPDETRGVVRGLKVAGVDFIKVHRRMERASYFAALDEAKRLGLPLVGHIPITVTPEEASDAGQATIEHVVTPFEGTFSAALKEGEFLAALRRFRESGAEAQLFARFVKNKTVFDPTLVPYVPVDPAAPPDPRMRYVAKSEKDIAEKRPPQPKPSAEQTQSEKDAFAEFKEIVRVAHGAGVILIAGTDIAASRIPGFTLHGELALLVESGLTPLEALQAATRTCAQVMNQSADLGTVTVGQIADLVLLDADPLADIHNTERIRAVIVGGKLYDRRALDGLLRQAEEMAAKN